MVTNKKKCKDWTYWIHGEQMRASFFSPNWLEFRCMVWCRLELSDVERQKFILYSETTINAMKWVIRSIVMAWKWNWAICHQLMIIFLKNSACSGKYSRSSSLVTQTKSSHFPMLNFWASTTWDLKKNRWQKEKHRLGKQHTLEGTPSEVHVCNQYEKGID